MMKILSCMSRQDSRDTDAVYRPRRKMVMVGDWQCGKTCLLHRYTKDEFDQDRYIPNVFQVVTSVEHQKIEVDLVVYDRPGQEGTYDRLCPVHMHPHTDVVLICFSVDNPDSLENVSSNLAPEVRHFWDNVPVVLVGLKSDLRDKEEVREKSKSKLTSVRQGEDMAYRIGAVTYMECSAKLNAGVADIFRTAVAEAMKKRKTGRKMWKR